MDYFKVKCDKTTLKSQQLLVEEAKESEGEVFAQQLQKFLFKQVGVKVYIYEFDQKVAGFRYGLACRPMSNMMGFTVTNAMTKDWNETVTVRSHKTGQNQGVYSAQHWFNYLTEKLEDRRKDCELHAKAKGRVRDFLEILKKEFGVLEPSAKHTAMQPCYSGP